MIVVRGLAAHIDHGVDRRRAADHLAARIIQAAAVETFLGLGLEAPVGARIANGEQIANWNMKPYPVVAAAGLEDEYALAGICGQAVGEDAASRAGAGDDVVVVAVERAQLAPFYAPRNNASRSIVFAITAVIIHEAARKHDLRQAQPCLRWAYGLWSDRDQQRAGRALQVPGTTVPEAVAQTSCLAWLARVLRAGLKPLENRRAAKKNSCRGICRRTRDCRFAPCRTCTGQIHHRLCRCFDEECAR